jgi:DNA-binding transcriptional LysR family regulator
MTMLNKSDTAARDLDIQQLQLLDTLLREGSLTKAALALDMTQPALSKILAKLRVYFDDPLFVRVGQRMEPTPKAAAMATPITAILQGVRQLQSDTLVFDPLTSVRHFNLYMIDAAVVFLLPALLKHVRVAAPHIHIQAVQCEVRYLDLWLESGVVDFAVGSFSSLVNGVHRQRLWTETYSTIARRGHPRVGKKLSLEAFVREQHAFVSVAGTGHEHAAAERHLEAAIPAANILCRVPTFTGAAHIVKHTDALATLPHRLALSLAADLDLQVLPAPLALPQLELGQYWHERYHRDPALQWLRTVFRELFSDSPR